MSKWPNLTIMKFEVWCGMTEGEIVEGWTYSNEAFCIHRDISVPIDDYLR